MSDNRIEHDPLGPVSVPKDRYYGAQMARALENFPISGISKACHFEGVQANAARCEANLKNSTAFATELATPIGYEAAAQHLKERLAS
ncbi:hypothetical protein I6F15_31365 [Bradyrhizobium sp. BRP14]|nr:hypothetical protein [Bradyrhizobium sp. BRP14]